MLFRSGDYETAAFQAMKSIEVRVRGLGDYDNSRIGVSLMTQAFRPDDENPGPLADRNAEKGEQVATMNLFQGAIGAFKNPVSHRQVDYDDPMEAARVVQLADLLHRLLDRTQARVEGR